MFIYKLKYVLICYRIFGKSTLKLFENESESASGCKKIFQMNLGWKIGGCIAGAILLLLIVISVAVTATSKSQIPNDPGKL